MGVHSPPFTDHCPQLPPTCFPPCQEVANTAWALATLEHHSPPFMDRLLEAAQQLLPGFTPQVRHRCAQPLT